MSTTPKQLLRRALSLGLAVGLVGFVAPAGAQDPTGTTTTRAPQQTTTTKPPASTTTTTAAPAPTTTTAKTPVTKAPPATQAPVAATAPAATLPPAGEEPSQEGGGDVGEKVTPPPTASGGGSSNGNTGGGAIIGENPIRELAPGVWETPVLVGGEAGAQGISLRAAADTVRRETETVAFQVEEQRSAAKARVIEAETALVQAERALNDAKRALSRREEIAEAARKQLARMGVASYTNLYGADDPDVLAMTGQTMRASVVREYSGTVMVGADKSQARATAGLDEAKAQVKKLSKVRNTAKAALAETRKGLADTEASLAKLVTEASALSFDDPADPNDSAPALPELPDGALQSTTTGADPAAGLRPDPALSALLATDLTVTYPIAADWNFVDSWGFERAGGARSHKGNDLFSRYGSPVVAVEDGVARVSSNSLGGLTVYLYGRSGNRYYYAHLSAVTDGIDGQQVEVGQVIGKVGTSGNAIGTPPHVHFEVQPPGGDTSNPYPMLKALALAVTQARDAGATPTVRAQDLLKLPEPTARTLWAGGRVRSDTLRRLGTDEWVSLINKTILPVEALALGDPLIAAEVAKRLPDAVDPASLPEVTGGSAIDTLPPVQLPLDAKAPLSSPPTSQGPLNPGSGGNG